MEARRLGGTAASLTRDALAGSRYGVFRKVTGHNALDMVLWDYQEGRVLKHEPSAPPGGDRSRQVARFTGLKRALNHGGPAAERVRRVVGR